MKTLGQAAKDLEIPKGTLRGWVSYYADYLSESAKPPKGEVKLLDDEDMAVLWTVHFLRAKHRSKADIADSLEDGERYFPDAARASGKTEAGSPAGKGETAGSALEIYDAFKFTLEKYENRLTGYESRIETLTERLLAAEVARSAAVAQLKILAEQNEINADSRAAAEIERAAAELRANEAETRLLVAEEQQQQQSKPVGFWSRIFGR